MNCCACVHEFLSSRQTASACMGGRTCTAYGDMPCTTLGCVHGLHGHIRVSTMRAHGSACPCMCIREHACAYAACMGMGVHLCLKASTPDRPTRQPLTHHCDGQLGFRSRRMAFRNPRQNQTWATYYKLPTELCSHTHTHTHSLSLSLSFSLSFSLSLSHSLSHFLSLFFAISVSLSLNTLRRYKNIPSTREDVISSIRPCVVAAAGSRAWRSRACSSFRI